MTDDAGVMLITGTRKGIGRALVEYYAKGGWRVVGCSRAEFEGQPENYEHFCLDVNDESAVRSMFGSIRKTYGRLDVLINNAGVASMNHALLTPVSKVQEILATNVVGTFLFCREAAKLMQKNHFGRIVNFSSVAVPLHLEGEAAYAASKAAVVSLTQVLGRELAEMGITVNAIGPTPVQTDLIAGVPAAKMQALLERQAICRYGKMEDIFNVIDFFIRPESSYITGQVIYLGGVA